MGERTGFFLHGNRLSYPYVVFSSLPTPLCQMQFCCIAQAYKTTKHPPASVAQVLDLSGMLCLAIQLYYSSIIL